MLVLCQRYSLLAFSKKAAGLERPNDLSNLDDEELHNKIRHLKNEIAFFYLRVYFRNISNITHQEEVYGLLRKTMNIDELIDEMKNENRNNRTFRYIGSNH